MFLCNCANETVESSLKEFRTDKVITALHHVSMHVLYYISTLANTCVNPCANQSTGLGSLPDQQSVNSSVFKTVIAN